MPEEYKRYTDANGVTWTIASGDPTVKTMGHATLLAYVADEADVKYEPPAEDFAVTLKTDEDNPEEAMRRSFIDLREQIDDYASKHKQTTLLKVHSGKGNGAWWLLAGIAWLLLSE